MQDPYSIPDDELVALELDLLARVAEESVKPITGVPLDDERVASFTQLEQVRRERKQRLIPDVMARGSVYEVRWAQQTSDIAVEFVTDRYEVRREAILRAVDIGLARREAGDIGG